MQAALPSAPSRLWTALLCTAAGMIVGAIGAVYGLASARHARPPGHPWAPISLACLVVAVYVWAFRRARGRSSTWGLGIAVVLAVVATGLWVYVAVCAAAV